MKNYFESEDYIVSFEKVISVIIDGDKILVYTMQHNIPKTCFPYYKFSIDQLANYKDWLESQSNSSEIPTSSHLEKIQNLITNIKTEKLCDNANIPQLKWLIECWEATTGNKYESLTSDDIEDFLYECLTLLDYAGCLNNKNRGDYLIGEKSNSQGILTSCSEKANDLVLTREQVTRIIRRIGDCTICKAYQRIGKFEDALVPCKKCEVYSNLNPLDEIVKEINELIKEC